MPGARELVGLLTAEPDALLVCVAAQAGLDFLVLDAEQTSLDVRRCAEVVQALRGLPVEVVIRVPDLAAHTLVTYANTGADELLLPQLRSPDQLKAANDAVQFPPVGTRSRQVSPASRYGVEFTRSPRLGVLVETVDALDELEAIAASGLVACAWFGPTDLADDLARHRPESLERIDELIDKGIATLRAHDVPVGLPARDAAGVRAAFDRGAEQCSVYWEKCLLDVLTGIAGEGSRAR